MRKEDSLTYNVALGVLWTVVPLPLFWGGYQCVIAGEYWPVLLFAVMTYFSWFNAVSMFLTAREIKSGRINRDDSGDNSGDQ